MISSELVLRAGFLVMAGLSFFNNGRVVARLASREAATAWLLVGALLFGVSFTIAQEFPSAPTARFQPLRSTWLETLPMTVGARMIRVVLQTLGFSVWCAALIFGAAPKHAWSAAPIALAIMISGPLIGLSTSYVFRLVFPPHWVARTQPLAMIVGLAGMFCAFIAPSFASKLAAPPWPISAWAHQIATGDTRFRGEPFLVALLVSALCRWVIAVVERRGFDRLDPATPGRQKRDETKPMTIPIAEQRMTRRQRQSSLLALLAAAIAISGTVAAALIPRPKMSTSVAEGLVLLANGLVAYLGWITAMNHAIRSVQRDAHARAFLASLPISPDQTLAGKVTLVRILIAPALLVYVPLVLWLPKSAMGIVLPWAASIALALWLFGSAAVSVAFLSGGLGIRSPMSGAAVNLDTILLSLPIAGVVAAPTPLLAVPSLLALAMVTFEAHRSAGRCVRWIDEPAPEGEATTETWRALLVFAAFMAVQALGARILESIPGMSPAVRTAIAYVAGALILLPGTYSGRKTGRAIAILPEAKGASSMVLGMAGGALSGLFALGYVAGLRRFGLDLSAGPPGDSTVAEGIALMLVFVGLAPIAEEVFFRGWLQDSIHADLARHRVGISVAIGAVAFASVHPPASFVPVLFLGIVCGALYARTGALAAGIAAHAVHNAIVLTAS